MNDQKEIRLAAPLEFRGADDEGKVKVSGYAAVFNQRTSQAGYYDEVIAPGAFDGVLGDDVVFLINHDGLPLARTSSGTLSLSVDGRGLMMAAELDGTDPDVARIVPKMKRGDLTKMSFGFVVDAHILDESGEVPLRTITKMRHLIDVSIVTSPAYSGTEIGLRSLDAIRAEIAPAPMPAEAVAAAMRMRLALIDQAPA